MPESNRRQHALDQRPVVGQNGRPRDPRIRHGMGHNRIGDPPRPKPQPGIDSPATQARIQRSCSAPARARSDPAAGGAVAAQITPMASGSGRRSRTRRRSRSRKEPGRPGKRHDAQRQDGEHQPPGMAVKPVGGQIRMIDAALASVHLQLLQGYVVGQQ